MASVRVRTVLPGSVHEAEGCWYDTSRWPEWVDSLARIVSVEGDWPRTGASVVWDSTPAGRGRVREHVIAYEALGGQTLAVQDETLEGRQRVSFEPAQGGVQVQLSLAYSIRRRSPLTPLVDRLFVRRAVALSLTKTLERFGAVLAASRGSGLG
jgi:Polyketide cyclase / dehydrase and lipid transport